MTNDAEPWCISHGLCGLYLEMFRGERYRQNRCLVGVLCVTLGKRMEAGVGDKVM